MPLYPGAVQRPMDTKFLSGGTIIVPANRTNVHTQGGNGSLLGYYSQTGKPSSHGWVAKTGVVEQYVDTLLRAEADLDGNDATISWEVEGVDEPYTQAQIDALIPLLRWTLDAHGIWNKVAENSFIGDSSKGLSWHRLGIDGNFPELPSRYAGRKQRGGGMHYSTSTGKVCPGNARIDQLLDIVFPAVLGQAPVVPPVTPPTPPVQEQRLHEDGQWGAATTTWQQRILGTEPDGVISHQYKSPANENIYAAQFDKTLTGSNLGRAIQHRLHDLGRYEGQQDGLLGDKSIRGLQGFYQTPNDGIISPTSTVVAAIQAEINRGSFLGVAG